MFNKEPGESINWLNTLFIFINLTVGVVGTLLLLCFNHVPWMTWLLALSCWVSAGLLGITVGYHRYFSHKTFQAVWPLRLIFLLFAAGAYEGSVLEWCTDHRNHHRYVDTPKDPYNIKRGFWYAHIGWLLFLNTNKRDFSNVSDLLDDPLCRFQHKYYIVLSIIMGYILPACVAGFFWQDFWGGLLIAGALRIALLQQLTFCINSVCHFFGKRNYGLDDTARDNPFTAYLTFGEGFHDYHHKFPLDYRNGLRWYDYDPSKWFIFTCHLLGLTSDLKRVSHEKQLKYRLRFDWHEFKSLSSQYISQPVVQVLEQLHPMYDTLLAQIKNIESIDKSIKEFKKLNKIQLDKKIQSYKILLKKKKVQLKLERLELHSLMLQWRQLIAMAH